MEGAWGLRAEWPEKLGKGTEAQPTEASGGLARGKPANGVRWGEGLRKGVCGEALWKGGGQGRIPSRGGWITQNDPPSLRTCSPLGQSTGRRPGGASWGLREEGERKRSPSCQSHRPPGWVQAGVTCRTAEPRPPSWLPCAHLPWSPRRSRASCSHLPPQLLCPDPGGRWHCLPMPLWVLLAPGLQSLGQAYHLRAERRWAAWDSHTAYLPPLHTL